MGKIKAIKGLGKAFLEALKEPEIAAGKIVKIAKKEKKGVLIGIGAAAITDALLEAQNKKKDKKKSKDKE